MNITIDEFGLHINSKTFIGKSVDKDILDIGLDYYDGKVLYYPDGKYQIVKADRKKFRVPIPNVIQQKPRHVYVDMFPDETQSNDRSERQDNMDRAKNRIYQIIFCNEWNYFLTLTFDDSKVDAADVGKVIKKSTSWLKNMVQRKDFGYLAVPEYHKKDKRVHLHCLIKGELDLSFDDVYKVKGLKKPVKISTIQRKGIPEDYVLYPVYRCNEWKYGFSSAIEVYGSHSRLANYTTKYITKDLKKIFGRFYWCSHNLRLYPDTELYNLNAYEFRETPGKEHYSRGSGVSYKYVNRLGDSIEELCDEEETI